MLLSFTKQICLFLLFINSFCLIAQTPTNNECVGASDINALFGQVIDIPQTSEIFDNTNATTETSDPTTGYECFSEQVVNESMQFPLIENTLWFSFVGDGEIYYITTTECNTTNYLGSGDTQMAIYSGACTQLTSVMCNEDGPTAPQGEFPAGLTIPTEAGVTYYMMIDGFNFGGTLSSGEFCIEVTKVNIPSCDDGNGGIATSTENVCFQETVSIAITNVEIPALPQAGFYWAISSADISGSTNPNEENSFLQSLAITDTPSTLSIANNGMELPFGQYFFTAVTFADAEVNTIGGVDLATAGCVFTSESVPVNFVEDLEPLSIDLTGMDDMGSADGFATVSTSGGSGAYTYLWSNGATTATIDNLAGGDYTVTVSDLSGCVEDFVESVSIGYPVSNEELADWNGIEIFPNPATDIINVSFDFNKKRDISIHVVNMIGQVVLTQNRTDLARGTFTLNVADLPEGIYLVQLTDGTKQTVQKIFIDR